MNIATAYPSKYLKAGDLQGHTVKVMIDRVVLEEIGQGDDTEHKPCLYFEGKEKGIVLNVTNGNAIAEHYGDETDDWGGRPLEVYPDKTQFKGKSVDCIRVRVPNSQPEQAADIPF